MLVINKSVLFYPLCCMISKQRDHTITVSHLLRIIWTPKNNELNGEREEFYELACEIDGRKTKQLKISIEKTSQKEVHLDSMRIILIVLKHFSTRSGTSCFLGCPLTPSSSFNLFDNIVTLIFFLLIKQF